MVVQPNSTIILYSGMPLDNTYSDTLWFQTKSNRDGFFSNVSNPYRKTVLKQNTYQRVNSNVFEARILADSIYDVNYMAFQNTNYGDKWFYAFVNSVEYINNLNTRITYTIDVIQTYFFDCDFEKCFVEREHSVYDNLWENITPEPIQLSEYVYQGYNEINWETNYSSEPHGNYHPKAFDPDTVVMIADTEGSVTDGGYIGLGYTGCEVWSYLPPYLPNQEVHVNGKIKDYIQKPESIIAIFESPHFLTKGQPMGYQISADNLPDSEFRHTFNLDYTDIFGSNMNRIGEYAFRNKKLMTYPFSFLRVDSGKDSLNLRFEFFARPTPSVNHDIMLAIFGSTIPPQQVSLSPINYKGNNESYGLLTERITLDEFPMCSWNYDTYRAWLAQNAVPMAISAATLGASSLLTGGTVGATSAGVGGLSILSDVYKASIQADTLRGNAFSGNAIFGAGKQMFHYTLAHQPEEIMEQIDDFFDMYGYATKRVKIPNTSSRPHWNYVKTKGAKLIGRCPTESLSELCRIFDNGITFWKNASEVGDYSLDNTPRQTP